MSDDLTALVEALPGTVRVGEELEFTCPQCHAARTGVLHDDGSVMCRAGCWTEDVIGGLRGGPSPQPSDLLTADEAEVLKALRRRLANEEADRRYREMRCSEFASAWDGIPGDLFDPDTPEPAPRVLVVEGRPTWTAGIHIVFGFPESAKTWLCYVAMAQEAAEGRRSLLVDYEMTYESSMRRLHVLGATKQQRALVRYVAATTDISDDAKARLVAQFGAEGPSVVVWDSVGPALGAAGADANSDSDVSRWAADGPTWMKRQWPDAVILLIDHPPKSGGTTPGGTGRKHAFADAMWRVDVIKPFSRTQRGSSRLVLMKDRDGYGTNGDEVLNFEFGAGEPYVLGSVEPPEPGTVMVPLDRQPSTDDEVLRDLRAAGVEGTNRTALLGRGERGKYRRDALARLLNRGLAREWRSGRMQMVAVVDG